MHVLASCTSSPEAVLQRLLSALLPTLTQQVACKQLIGVPPLSLNLNRVRQDLDVKNAEGETPLSVAKKQGNEAVAKALKAFGTRPLPLAHSVAAPSAIPTAAAPPAQQSEPDDVDEDVEPARTCFPNYAYDRSTRSADRAQVVAQRLLELARKMMRTCVEGNAPLMRQSLLEWNSCMSQCVRLRNLIIKRQPAFGLYCFTAFER